MSVAVPLLLGSFMMCCTGSAEGLAKRLHINTGYLAALSLLSAMLWKVTVPVGESLSLHPASLLLTILFGCSGGRRGGLSMLPLLAACIGGGLGWLLTVLFPAFGEPGLLLAAMALLAGLPFLPSLASMLACVMTAPMIAGALMFCSDLYLFGEGILPLGGSLHLEAQAAGMWLLGLVYGARKGQLVNKKRCQKET